MHVCEQWRYFSDFIIDDTAYIISVQHYHNINNLCQIQGNVELTVAAGQLFRKVFGQFDFVSPLLLGVRGKLFYLKISRSNDLGHS